MRCQLSKQQQHDELSMLFLSWTTITIKIKWIFHRRKRIFFSVWGYKKTFRLQLWFSQSDFTSGDFASASFICLRQTQTPVVHDSLWVKTVLLLCREPLSSSGSSGRVRGAEKHEIYAAAFGGHLFYDPFSQGRGGPWPPRPPPGSATAVAQAAVVSW